MAAITPHMSIMNTYTRNSLVTTSLLETLNSRVLTNLQLDNACYPISKLLIYKVQAFVKQLTVPEVIELALFAYKHIALRTVAFVLMRELIRSTRNTEYSTLIAPALVAIMQRPEDLIDFLDLYWLDAKQPLTKQLKKALTLALQTFDAAVLTQCSYQQQRKLRDVLRLVHPKPQNAAQAAAWRFLAST